MEWGIHLLRGIVLIGSILFGGFNALGQIKISGQIRTLQGKSIPDINILVHPPNHKNSILAFTFSKPDGSFEIEFKATSDTVAISFTSLNYADTTYVLISKTQQLDILLVPSIKEIKEVLVTSRPIYERGDTTKYIVDSFVRTGNQAIGDVIQNMPGFAVDEQGKISFQGRQIEKYYIEGMDLLENSYNVANKNLPHSSVASVEVLHGHQPLKILEGLVKSDNVSINLKLKKNIAVTGLAKVGMGLTPFLHDVSVSPMLFNPKMQAIGSLQSNNIGEDMRSQNQVISFKDGRITGLDNIKINPIGVTRLVQPMIPSKRFNNNSSNYFTFNHLQKPGPSSEFKTRTTFADDIIKETGESSFLYFISDSIVKLEEFTNNRIRFRNFSTDFTYLRNEDRSYISNKLGYSGYWDNTLGTINNTSSLNQSAQNPQHTLFNEFEMLIPIQKKLLKVYSMINYKHAPQHLNVSPGVFQEFLNGGIPYNTIFQRYDSDNLIASQHAALTFFKNGWSFSTEPGFSLGYLKLTTSIYANEFPLTADSLNNRISWRYSDFYINETIKKEKNRWRVQLDIPIKAIGYDISDHTNQSNQRKEKIEFEPYFNLRYQITPRLWGQGSIRYSSKLGSPTEVADGYILTDYRTLNQTNGKINEITRTNYNLTLEYKNAISGLFGNIRWNHSNTLSNLMPQREMLDAGIIRTTLIEKENHSHSRQLSGNFTWYIASLRSTIGLMSQYATIEREYFLNATPSQSNNQLFSISPSLIIACWRKFDFEYRMKWEQINYKTPKLETRFIRHSHKASAIYAPSKVHSFHLSLETFLLQSNFANADNKFIDATYILKPSNKKYQIAFKCNNLLDNANYIEISSGEFYQSTGQFLLRGREFLAILSFPLSRGNKKSKH